MMKFRSRSAAVLAAIGLSLSGLTACGGPAGDSENPLIKVAYAPDVFFAPLYVADQKGFFDEAGLNVEVTPYPSSVESGQALITGQTDVTAGSSLATAALLAKAPDRVKVLGGYLQADRWWGVVADESVKSIDDLAGKTIATQFGAQSELFGQRLISTHGLDATLKNVKFTQLISSLARSEFPAIITFEPNVTKAVESVPGAHVVLWGDQDDLARVFGVIEVSAKVFENPEVAKKLTAALDKTSAWMTENPDEAAEIVAETAGIDKETAGDLLGGLELKMTSDQAWSDAIDDGLKFVAEMQDKKLAIEASEYMMSPSDAGIEEGK